MDYIIKADMKKILLICTQSNQICGFRKSLIKKFQEKGLAVSAVAFDDYEKAEIDKMGIDFYCINNANRSVNPFKVLSLKSQYFKLIKHIQPDIVFTFMLKPNIYGVKAAKAANVEQIFSMVEGSGDVFINNSLKWKGIRWFVCKMYRSAFKSAKKVFFLNKEDEKEFLGRRLVSQKQCEGLNGIGVDLERFQQKSIVNQAHFLMVARMLRTKGVMEYCQAARLVKQQYPNAVFNYVGWEGGLKVSDIKEYIDDGSVCYLGDTKDVRPYLEACSVYVLPSYREGMPVSVMEAAATGRALLVSDCPGCNATVVNGYNGYITPVGNVELLVEKMQELLQDAEKVVEMGANSRAFAEKHFNQTVINERICEIIGLN